jgi:hypothetical protein
MRPCISWKRDDTDKRINMNPSYLGARNPLEIVTEICTTLGARAAGWWRIDHESGRLVQVAFVPGAGLDTEAGLAFAAATRAVSLGQKDLGIVIAVTTGQPALSRVDELRSDAGSGHWLRAFGATRSIAVPVRDHEGTVRGVVSVALPANHPLGDGDVIVSLLRKAKT